MAPKDYLFAVFVGGAYVFLYSYLTGYTTMWGDPSSWFEVWGRSAASALAWMQIVHSAGVCLAALPAGVVIAWRYREDWFPPAAIAAITASSCTLVAQIHATWSLVDLDSQPADYILLSGAIDTVKVGVILLLVTALLRWIMRARKARE